MTDIFPLSGPTDEQLRNLFAVEVKRGEKNVLVKMPKEKKGKKLSKRFRSMADTASDLTGEPGTQERLAAYVEFYARGGETSPFNVDESTLFAEFAVRKGWE